VPSPILLEISVESTHAAVAAVRGGAQRIELCAELRLGGLTPTEELMRGVRERVQVPIFGMIRPREGDFVYSESEFERMRSDIGLARRAGMDGIVLGLLTCEQNVDVKRTRELVNLAKPLPVTFHRAFDHITDLDAGLEDVIVTGATRVLTSGGASSAPAGMESLARLAATAKERIVVVPGGGINSTNIVQIARRTAARELHSGLGSVFGYGQKDYDQFQSEVRNLAEQLASVA
jgi:copper homeostasis protein